MLQKNIDKISDCGVLFGHLLNTGNPATAPVSIAVSLCPASEGMLGWTGNILNTCRSWLRCVQHPSTRAESLEQELTMKTPTRRTTSEIPEMWRNRAEKAADKLYEIGVKLSFVTEAAPFMQKNAELTEAGLSGLWWMLSHIQDDILEAGAQLAEIRKNGGEA